MCLKIHFLPVILFFLIQGLLGDGGFVGDDDLCVPDALGDQRGLPIGGAVIDRQLAQFLQFGPAQVS